MSDMFVREWQEFLPLIEASIRKGDFIMTDLNNLVERTMSAYHQYETQQKQQAEEQKQQAEQEAETALQRALTEALSDEFLESTGFKFDHVYDRAHHYISALFNYGSYDWHLSYDQHQSTWNIYTTRPGSSSIWSHKKSGLTSAEIQTVLLVEIGKYREEIKQEEEKRATRLRWEEEQHQTRERIEATAEAEQITRIAAAEAEHERLLALLTAERAKVEREMFRWLEGVTIEVYHLEYCKGSYRDEEDEASFDYGSGWTSVAHLDEQCRIQIEPVNNLYGRFSQPRVIQLMPDIHKPVWTVHHFSSVEELPDTLRHDVEVSLPNVVKRREPNLDGKYRLVEDTVLDYDEHWYSKKIGEEPLPWIQALIVQVVKSQVE